MQRHSPRLGCQMNLDAIDPCEAWQLSLHRQRRVPRWKPTSPLERQGLTEHGDRWASALRSHRGWCPTCGWEVSRLVPRALGAKFWEEFLGKMVVPSNFVDSRPMAHSNDALVKITNITGHLRPIIGITRNLVCPEVVLRSPARSQKLLRQQESRESFPSTDQPTQGHYQYCTPQSRCWFPHTLWQRRLRRQHTGDNLPCQ